MELALRILGVSLAVLALSSDRLQRPRLEIKPAPWEGDDKELPRQFLVVRVYNRPLSPRLGWRFTRRSAEDCYSLDCDRAGRPLLSPRGWRVVAALPP
jgi:hypothetical protein